MMPSRGLQLARSQTPRLYQLQCRNLSSASRRAAAPPSRNNVRSHLQWSGWRPSAFITAPSALAARHASSTPLSAPPLAAAPPPNPDSSASSTPPAVHNEFPTLDTISIEGIELDSIANVSEKIGYLHEIGINYGWGVTSSLQWIIEHLHISGGLPWWGAIATTAVLIRLCLFPLYLKSSDIMARTAALGPVMKPLQQNMNAARASKDKEAVQRATQEWLLARKRAGLSMPRQFAPMFAQMVLAFCGFRLIRNMATLPVPAFTTEGPLWLQDLTLSDPYLILPIVMAGVFHILVRMGGESGAANPLSPGMQKFMLYGLPGLTLIFLGWQPAALCIWFAAGGVFGIAQSYVLRQPAVRQYFGIAPMFTPPKGEQENELMDTLFPSMSKPKAKPERPITMSAGKNGAYMNPTYQSPKLNRNTSTRTFIDVKGTTKPQPSSSSASPFVAPSSDMIQPNRPRQSVVDEASKAWKGLRPNKAKTSSATQKKSRGR